MISVRSSHAIGLIAAVGLGLAGSGHLKTLGGLTSRPTLLSGATIALLMVAAALLASLPTVRKVAGGIAFPSRLQSASALLQT